MKGGRKPLSAAEKEARGTRQKCRDKEEIVVPATDPQMPTYLSADAKKIWKDELPRVKLTGITNVDSSLFARYCAVEALVRQMFRDGLVPQGNLLTELRRMGECLGLTGPSSRVGKSVEQKPTNPFAALTRPTLVKPSPEALPRR